MNAIYNRTTGRIQSTVYTDKAGIERVQYTGSGRYDPATGQRDVTPDLTLVEYIATHDDDLDVLPLSAAIELAEAASVARYCSGWHEISADDWQEALNCLPPENWQKVLGVSIFRCSERLTGNITAHYAQVGSRYWCANLPTTTRYTEIAVQVHQLTGEGVSA